MLLDGKIALITGAGAGIGAAVARRFAAEGAILWLNDLDSDSLAAVVEETGGTGMAGDASDPEFVATWVEEAVRSHGRVDVLYHNVGVHRSGRIADLTDEQWHFQQRLTLDTCFYATRAVIPHMLAAGKGSIVAMSSGAGIGGQYGLGGYAAAKAGVISLMETVATEYGDEGIRANSVTPGPTSSAPLLDYLENQDGGIDAHTADLNLARLTEPEEVAAIVAWLASDEASSINGMCIQSNTRMASRRPPQERRIPPPSTPTV